MSGLKFRWLKAFNVADLPPQAKVIGVQIFNYTDAKGHGAHPGQQRLAKDLSKSKGFSEASVKRYLKVLRESGWITKTKSSNATGAKKFADVYALTFPGTEGHNSDPRSDPTEGQNEATEGQNTPDRGSPSWATNRSSLSNPLRQRSWGDDEPSLDDDPWHTPGLKSGGGWGSPLKNFGKVPD